MSARKAEVAGPLHQVTVEARQTRLSLSPDCVIFHKNGIEFRSATPFSPWAEMTLTLQSPRDNGRIHCNGVYIGQSVRPLITAVRLLWEALPPGHRVSAVVVVYQTTGGELALPAPSRPDLGWTRAGDAVHDIKAHLPRGPQPVSVSAVAALVAATAKDGHCEDGTARGGLE